MQFIKKSLLFSIHDRRQVTKCQQSVLFNFNKRDSSHLKVLQGITPLTQTITHLYITPFSNNLHNAIIILCLPQPVFSGGKIHSKLWHIYTWNVFLASFEILGCNWLIFVHLYFSGSPRQHLRVIHKSCHACVF